MMELKQPSDLVALVKELRELGVYRLKAGDVEVEMLPEGQSLTNLEDQSEGESEDLMFYSSE